MFQVICLVICSPTIGLFFVGQLVSDTMDLKIR
jgi:hypothetical protein